MAPSKQQPAEPPFKKEEKVLCFHMDLLYEAKIVDVKPNEEGEGWVYRIHYKGWKSSWDDWATADRVRKWTPENQELAATLLAQKKKSTEKNPKQQAKKSGRGANGSDFGSGRGSEERSAGAITSSGRGGPRRYRDYDLDQEEAFFNRPSIKIPMTDTLKAILVDDWENVTKNQQLVPLPHLHPVEEILTDYMNHEKPSRQEGSAHADILEEVLAGIRVYFNRCLGRILLYRFERGQYQELHRQWTTATDDDQYHNACDTYGPEHLLRLIATLPELIAQTNMDQQSVNRLREELTKLTQWLNKNMTKYFASEYVTPSQEYIEKMKSLG